MTKDELIEKLKECAELAKGDREIAHIEADDALLVFINDPEITAAYEAFEKWHA